MWWCFYFVVLLSGLFGAFTLLVEIYLRTRPMYKVARAMPNGPKLRSFWDDLQFTLSLNLENTFTHLRSFALTHKQTYRYYSFGIFHVHIVRAEEAEMILSSTRHTDKSIFYHFLEPFMGQGLLISGGSKWFQRRKILTPAFHFNILQQFSKLFQEETVNLVSHIANQMDRRGTVSLAPTMSQFTLNTMCETSMGIKLDSLDEPDEYRKNIYKIAEHLVMRMVTPWLFSDAIYNFLGYRVQLDKHLNKIHSFTRKIIRTRREKALAEGGSLIGLDEAQDGDTESDGIYFKNRKQRYAMLDTLLAAEAKGLIDEEGIREEVDTFTFEGHDTTSTALTFILFLLATHQDVQQKVYEEIRSICAQNDYKPLEIAQYNSMSYTDRVIKECLRLYPPVSFISRESSEEFELYNHKIPAKTLVHLHIFDIHRDPKYFPSPETFDPDRFLPENCENRHPFAFIPFSAGPRNCIGQKFAMLEIKTVLEQLLMAFKLEAITKREDIVFISDLVLRSKNPIEVRFLPRV